MTYYVDPSVFYWINVAGGIRGVALTLLVVSIVILFIGIICYFVNFEYHSDEEENNYRRGLKAISPIIIISILMILFVPSKQTCIEMLIAKTVTVENVNTTIDGTKELIDYIFEKVNAK